MTDNKQTNVSPCIEADCRQHCGTFRAAKVSEIWVSLVQQQPLRGTFIPPVLSDLNAVASEQATGNRQQATGQQPLACIRIRNYDALTFWNIVAWLDHSLQSLPLPWLSPLSLRCLWHQLQPATKSIIDSILQFLLWSISMEIASV